MGVTLSVFIIHKWGDFWYHHSQQMKKKTIFQTYFSINKGNQPGLQKKTRGNINKLQLGPLLPM